MKSSRPGHVVWQLRRAALGPDVVGLTDAQLLGRFLEGHDEAAFEALVRRHAPMVLGVCRRVLRHEQDAEDAFQATFLVLARKAASVAPRGMLPNWLYSVAYRTALRAKAAAAKRRAKETQVTVMPEPEAAPADPWGDLRPVLDEELSRLPDKYRAPVVLCDLQGKTHAEAAGQLGWPVGTVSGRLSRARALLGERLSRRGLVLTAGSLATALSGTAASACVPLSLITSTVKAASLLAAGRAAATGAVSANAAALSQGVLNAMFLTKVKQVAAVFLLVGAGLAGIAVAGYALERGREGGGPAPAAQKDGPKADPAGRSADRQPGKQATKETRLRTLLKERLAILRQIADQLNRQHQTGTIPLAQVLDANRKVLEAELELVEDPKGRIAILEKMVGIAKQIEERVAEHSKAGVISQSAVLTARVNRLEAEIALERAKAKATGGPKSP
ncbi:MAG: RNA polymerase sigma factor [Gemmataceae bacterium]|nr:RNA polymerase sigma factor [Gemmataceae bacterium]